MTFPSPIEDCRAASTTPARRSVLQGAALVGLAGAAPLLTACGGDEAATDAGATSSPSASDPESAAPSATSAAGISTGAVAPGQAVLVEAAGTTVILAQPVAGEFKAYDTRCPHMGCKVAPAGALALKCPCHGSAFDATDGSMTNGPATTGLTERTVTVDGDQLTIA